MMKDDDRLPPPYDQTIGLARSSQGYTVVSVHEESLNEATPFGQPWYPEEDVNHHQQDSELESSSPAGSTETIPSLWEPRDDDPPISIAPPARRLVRSLSLDSLAVVRPAPITAARSCFDLSDGIYRHRHVRLSHYRRTAGLPGTYFKWQ